MGKTYRRLMLRFCHENQKAQKYLMGGIEKTIETFKDTLLAKTGGILKAFFDHDILDEEVIIEWGKKVSKKYVSKDLSEQIHKKAEPFLTWLKEAEEESEDEDEDVDLQFDDRAKISSIKQVVENGNKNSKESTPASKQTNNSILFETIIYPTLKRFLKIFRLITHPYLSRFREKLVLLLDKNVLLLAYVSMCPPGKNKARQFLH